jgi:hypothetical protein
VSSRRAEGEGRSSGGRAGRCFRGDEGPLGPPSDRAPRVGGEWAEATCLRDVTKWGRGRRVRDERSRFILKWISSH